MFLVPMYIQWRQFIWLEITRHYSRKKKQPKKPQICIHIKINLRHYFVIVMITSTPGLYVSKNPAEVSHDLGTGDFLYV